jgi:hypothetical protein
LTAGAISLSASSHLLPMLNSKAVKPVSRPPGRARLGTKPLPTGSVTSTKTIGSVPLTGSSPAITGVVGAKIKSGASPTSSFAWACRRLASGTQRYSRRRLRPSTQPSSRSPASNAWARTCPSGSVCANAIITPTRRVRSCRCARAASGHAAAAPPRTVMNSRRRMGSIRASQEGCGILPDLSPKVCDQSHKMHHTLRSATRKEAPWRRARPTGS